MSLATTLNLTNDSATDVDTNLVAYEQRASDVGYSEYSVGGLTLPTEHVMSVSHETRKNGVVGHRVQMNTTVVDALLVPATLQVSLVIARPPNTGITNALIISITNRLIDFLIEGGSNANLTKVLNREN